MSAMRQNKRGGALFEKSVVPGVRTRLPIGFVTGRGDGFFVGGDGAPERRVCVGLDCGHACGFQPPPSSAAVGIDSMAPGLETVTDAARVACSMASRGLFPPILATR